MDTTAGFTDIPCSSLAEGSIQRVVEGLWQKGYDLRKAGAGWVVREPLGGSGIHLASDGDLIEYANRGYKACPAPAKTQTQRESSTSRAQVKPLVSAFPVDEFDAKIAGPKVNTMAFLGGGAIVILLSIWTGSLFSQSGNFPNRSSSGEQGSEVVRIQKNGHVIHSPENDLAQRERPALAAPGNAESVVSADSKVDSKDLSSVSEQCVHQLEKLLGAKSPSLFINSRSSQLENCYLINGKEHCPYLSGHVAMLNYRDGSEAGQKVYACDVDLVSRTTGNVRLVPVNPDIVRFMLDNTGTEKRLH
jgi:hypothetical protein